MTGNLLRLTMASVGLIVTVVFKQTFFLDFNYYALPYKIPITKKIKFS